MSTAVGAPARRPINWSTISAVVAVVVAAAGLILAFQADQRADREAGARANVELRASIEKVRDELLDEIKVTRSDIQVTRSEMREDVQGLRESVQALSARIDRLLELQAAAASIPQ